jgi:hypothetical protein
MTIDPVETVERFLEDYTLRDEYHVKHLASGPVKRVVFAQYVEAEGAGVHVEFGVESDDVDTGDDPEVQALAHKAIDALRKADPGLAKIPIRVTFE